MHQTLALIDQLFIAGKVLDWLNRRTLGKAYTINNTIFEAVFVFNKYTLLKILLKDILTVKRLAQFNKIKKKLIWLHFAQKKS